jgi:hypothetical protein
MLMREDSVASKVKSVMKNDDHQDMLRDGEVIIYAKKSLKMKPFIAQSLNCVLLA